MAAEQPVKAAETATKSYQQHDRNTTDDWLVFLLRRPQLLHELRHVYA